MIALRPVYEIRNKPLFTFTIMYFLSRFSILFFLLFRLVTVNAQSNKQAFNELKKHLFFLADDRLEGRRTGTPGEETAARYIKAVFEKNKLKPAFGNDFLQPFDVYDGLKLGPKNRLRLGADSFQLGTDFIPLPYSATGEWGIDPLSEQLVIIDLDLFREDLKQNPHADPEDELYKKITSIQEKEKATVIMVYSRTDSVLVFDKKSKKDKLSIPVLQLKSSAARSIMGVAIPEGYNQRLGGNVDVTKDERTGYNVCGRIDNGSPYTIVIGAHYDHLGYGEDKNSLYAGSEPRIHNGADDNASGTSALLLLSKTLRDKKYASFNYLLVAFSGEELGLYGSKFFTEHPPVALNSVNYMINMDMVGRLNDSTKGLTIGGYGTSPVWSQLIPLQDKRFAIKIDSAGSGPSDHTSFYRKDIPVLFFFTGTHSDYHKPSDDADKVNIDGILQIVRYIEELIAGTQSMAKLPFLKTREAVSSAKSSFKVTLGIMPDYTFAAKGVHVEGVSDNKPAQKAGIQPGDVILKLGEFDTDDVQAYMKALSMFQKGQQTTVLVQRDGKMLTFQVTF